MSDSEPVSEIPVKRGRGRPRKDPSAAPVKKSAAVSNGATKGKRGRKPGSTNKAKPASNSATQGVKRGRGRPKKSETEKTSVKKAKKAESSESEVQDDSSADDNDE